MRQTFALGTLNSFYRCREEWIGRKHDLLKLSAKFQDHDSRLSWLLSLTSSFKIMELSGLTVIDSLVFLINLFASYDQHHCVCDAFKIQRLSLSAPDWNGNCRYSELQSLGIFFPPRIRKISVR